MAWARVHRLPRSGPNRSVMRADQPVVCTSAYQWAQLHTTMDVGCDWTQMWAELHATGGGVRRRTTELRR